MLKLVDELKRIGFDEDEAAAYVACLELRQATILQIARRTGINRSTLYPVIKRLQTKHLLSRTVVGKRTLFVVEPPEAIEKMLKDRLSRLSDILPELVSLGRKGVRKPKIKYFEDWEGIKSVYRDSLECRERKLFAFVGVDRLNVRSTELQDFWEGEYRRGREDKGIAGKVIAPDTPQGKAFKAKDKTSRRETRLVPSSHYNFEGEVLMHDDVVAFISYTEDEVFALQLESQAIAKTMRMIWQITWAAGY
jgi:sugar-specific transcriptional regulator TrmB